MMNLSNPISGALSIANLFYYNTKNPVVNAKRSVEKAKETQRGVDWHEIVGGRTPWATHRLGLECNQIVLEAYSFTM